MSSLELLNCTCSCHFHIPAFEQALTDPHSLETARGLLRPYCNHLVVVTASRGAHVLSHLRAFARAILVPGKLSYALLVMEVSPHCFCGPSLLPPPSWVLPVSFMSGICLPCYHGNCVRQGLCILFPLGFSECLASPSAGVLKE